MSLAKTAHAKDEAAPVSPVAATAVSDDAKSSNSNEVKELQTSIRQLSQQRRMLRQVQVTYSRIKKSQFKYIKPADDEVEKTQEKTPKDPEDSAKEKVKAAHRLLRNFNYAVNVQVMSREDDKRVFPQKFSAEIESLFDDKSALEKVKKALQTDLKEGQTKEIPNKLSDHTLKGIADFLEKYEKKEVIDKLETQLTDLTKQIDDKRSKLLVLRPEMKKTRSTPSTGRTKGSKASTKKSTTTHSDPEEE